MKPLAFALAIFTLGVCFAPRAPAMPGAMCERQAECGDPHWNVCVADCDACRVGHCVRVHVLP